MSDALARYRMAERQDKDALKRYKDASTGDTLGALAKYLGLRGYWDRQGRIATESLQMADEGAQSVRGGNFSGLPGAVLGPLRYIGSPVEALFPERSEVEVATDVPDWSKPLIAGGLETMAILAPGPKGKGLGRGVSREEALRNLVEEQIAAPVRQYTPEEIAKLKARLAAEKTAEDEAIARSRRYIPPIDDFIPPSRKPKN